MKPARLKKIVLVAGLAGCALFVGTVVSLYFYGTAAGDDEPTRKTLKGSWETRIIRRHDQRAVRLYARFDQPVDQVWQFVRNYEEYPERLDYVVSAEVVERSPEKTTLKLVTRGFPTDVSETLEMTYGTSDQGKKAQWTQVEGTLNHNDGEWEVIPDGSGTFLRYTMCVSYGGAVPDWLLHALLRLYASEIVTAIRDVVGKERPS